MDILFAKSVLYAYPNIEALCDQIDQLVLRDALTSMSKFSPAIIQCEHVLDLTAQKDVLKILKEKVESVLEKISESDYDLLDYKYFKIRPKKYYENVDTSSRNYFRRQVRVVEKFSEKLEKKGITNEWFSKYCLTINFFSELYKKVKDYEIKSKKNKPKKEKLTVICGGEKKAVLTFNGVEDKDIA